MALGQDECTCPEMAVTTHHSVWVVLALLMVLLGCFMVGLFLKFYFCRRARQQRLRRGSNANTQA